MNSKMRIEEKIDNMLNGSKNAGFTNPPTSYFEHFADHLPLLKSKSEKTLTFSFFRNNLLTISSFSVAALLLLALWVFVFNADIKNDTNFKFTIDELVTLRDFQNYNEDLIYSELALASEEGQYSNDEEADVLLDYNNISSDDIIDTYSSKDIK